MRISDWSSDVCSSDLVRFRHAAPDSRDEYRRVFGCPVQFDAAEDSLLFDAATLALPVRLASPGLKAVLAGHAQAALDLLGSGDPLRDAVAGADRKSVV